jgi:Tol biopolymer transport system component
MRSSSALVRLLVTLFLAAGLGCGGVREDRTVTFSPDGNAVGFQHGRDGVFVADKDGGGLTRVFTPGKDVLAASTPLWAPNDKRLIFTTARPAQKGGTTQVTLRWDDLGGVVQAEQPVVSEGGDC